MRCGQCSQLAAGPDADGVADALVLKKVVQDGNGQAAIAPELDRNLGPSSSYLSHNPLEDVDDAVTGMRDTGTQHDRDELIGLPLEEQERVVHVLLIIPVIGVPFLVAVRGIIGAIGIDQDVGGTTRLLVLSEVDAKKHLSQAVAGLVIDRVLEAGERGLTGEVGSVGQATADHREEGIRAQRIGIV